MNGLPSLLGLMLIASALGGLTAHRQIDIERIDPYAPNNLFAVLDVNHTRMRATGLFTETQIATLDLDSKGFVLGTFGLDFFNAEVGVFGALFYPNVSNAIAVMLPYTIGLDAAYPANQNFTRRLIFDSDNLDRGATKNWFFIGCGNLVLMLQNGTFTSGTQAGSKYIGGPLGTFQTQDGIGYASYNLLKENSDWSKKNNRNEFLAKTPWTVKQFANQYGDIESISKVLITDLDTNQVGYGLLVGTFADPWGDGYSAISPLNIIFKN